MKILWINNFFGPVGGAERSVYLTYKTFQKYGHDVFFFATDQKPFFESDYAYQHYFPPVVNYDKLKSPWMKLLYLGRPFYNKQAQSYLEAYLKDVQPDVVHCANIYYHLTPAVLSACKKLGIPVVMTLHDTRLMCPTGTLLLNNRTYCTQELCVGRSAAACVSNRCYGNNLFKSILVAAEAQFRKIHGLYDTPAFFIAPSQAIRDLAVRGGFAANKVVIINNFIDNTVLKTPVSKDYGQYFFFCGRLSEEKGIEDIFKALELLPRNYFLHIAGTGPQEQELKAWVKKRHLDNVIFLGKLDTPALVNQYRNAIASLVPSRWFENFSRSILESMACACPVVGNQIGGIPETIDDGINGLITQPGDIAGLAQAMKTLFEDRKLAREMGRRAARKAQRLYNEEEYYAKLYHIYQTAANKEHVNVAAPPRMHANV